MIKKCEKCKKTICEDWEEWLRENEHQAYIQCLECFHLEELGNFKKFIGGFDLRKC